MLCLKQNYQTSFEADHPLTQKGIILRELIFVSYFVNIIKNGFGATLVIGKILSAMPFWVRGQTPYLLIL